MTAPLLVAGVAALIAGEAFFALSEVALVSANRARLRVRADAGSGAAACALGMLAHPETLLATTLTGTNLCVVCASFTANEVAARGLGDARSAWAIVALAPFMLVFGEILPKALARRHADSLASLVAYPVRGAMTLLAPAVAVAGGLSRRLVASVETPGARHPFVTREELRALLRAERRAALDPEEARMIHRLLGMAASKVREVMTPLPDVVSIEAGSSVAAACETIRRVGYSRLPVYQERTDNIVGVVHALDIVTSGATGAGVASVLRRPFYVPESARLNQILDEFRRRGQEMAIVVDEFGASCGIVTFEDVLEEMVGDILDEFDRPHRDDLQREPSGDHVAAGSVRLSELSDRLGVSFPRAGYETLAGFIAHRLQRIPRTGDAVEFENLVLTVVDAGERRVRKVRIRSKPGPSSGSS
ncbi:MAG: HlyC/CorC family transporter [Acidobacteria bacterium]|nr:HlyC/CorC family transporter [Acidobacteriota bacterium]